MSTTEEQQAAMAAYRILYNVERQVRRRADEMVRTGHAATFFTAYYAAFQEHLGRRKNQAEAGESMRGRNGKGE